MLLTATPVAEQCGAGPACHGGLGGRSDIATLNRPFQRGRGAAASTLNGFARQQDTEFGSIFLREPQHNYQKTTEKQPYRPNYRTIVRTVFRAHAAADGLTDVSPISVNDSFAVVPAHRQSQLHGTVGANNLWTLCQHLPDARRWS